MLLRTKLPALLLLAVLLIAPALPAKAAPALYVKEVLRFETTPHGGTYGALAYDGERYVYVSYNSEIFTSPDGLNWIQVPVRPGDLNRADGPRRLIWTGRLWVLAAGNSLFSSPDLIQWQRHPLPDPDPSRPGPRYEGRSLEYEVRDMLYVNGTYHVLATDRPKDYVGIYMAGPNAMLISTDLKSWRLGAFIDMEKTVIGERPVETLAYHDGLFIGVGNTGAWSTDGEHWFGNDMNWGDNLVWDGKRFISARMDFVAATADGKTYQLLFDGENPKVYLSHIDYNGREYLAVGHPERRGDTEMTVLYSADGSNWEWVTIPDMPLESQAIMATPHSFLVAGRDRLLLISSSPIATPSAWAEKEVTQARLHRLVPTRLLNFYQAHLTRKELGELTGRLYEVLRATRPAAGGATLTGDGSQTAPSSTSDQPVTRQEVALVLLRTLRQAGVSLTPATAGGGESASDASALLVLQQAGIMTGEPRPTAPVTREEAMVIMERAYQRSR